MSDTVITRQLTRAFDGREVVKEVNLRVEQGSIYGLIGRNGAGKRGGSQVFPQRCWLCWICSDGRKKWRDR